MKMLEDLKIDFFKPVIDERILIKLIELKNHNINYCGVLVSTHVMNLCDVNR